MEGRGSQRRCRANELGLGLSRAAEILMQLENVTNRVLKGLSSRLDLPVVAD